MHNLLQNLKPRRSLLGLVDLLYHVANAHFPLDVSPEDCHLISGAAIQHYYYSQELNGEKPKQVFANERSNHFSKQCGLFNTFGPFDSLKFYTNLNIQDFYHLNQNDFQQLISFELAHQRPLLTFVDDDVLRPACIWCDQTPFLSYFSDDAVVTLPFSDTELNLSLFLVTIRGKCDNPALLGRPEQRKTLLQWACKHAHRSYEFIAETDEAYCTGFQSWNALLEDLSSHTTSPCDLPPHLTHHLLTLQQSRLALADALDHWGIHGDRFRQVAQALQNNAPQLAYLIEKQAFFELAQHPLVQ